jgi:sarcosine oxidase subunit alpha
VGLSPLTELINQSGGKLKYIRELSGYVPIHNEDLKTTIEDIYVAGDIAGVEEASSAMVEGKLAGAKAVSDLGFNQQEAENIAKEAHQELSELRSGPVGEIIRRGIKKLKEVE